MVTSHFRVLIGIALAILLLVTLMSMVSAANPEVIITVASWHSVPYPPTDFTITQISLSSINITWTPGLAANITIVRGSTTGYPFNIFDGSEIYSGNGTSVVVEDLDLTTNTYYYRAWSQNEYGVSTGYAQDSIGEGGATSGGIGSETVLLTLFGILGLGFTYGFFWKRSSLFAYGAAGMWALLGFVSFQASSSGNPANITDVYMGLFWMCVGFTIACALLPTVMRERPEMGEIYAETDDVGDDLSPFTTPKRETEARPEKSVFNKTGVIK